MSYLRDALQRTAGNLEMEEAEDVDYFVVRNAEEQYSIWLADKTVPAGWVAIGDRASKKACLDYIEQNWTDMRPLSLRRRMDA